MENLTHMTQTASTLFTVRKINENTFEYTSDTLTSFEFIDRMENFGINKDWVASRSNGKLEAGKWSLTLRYGV